MLKISILCTDPTHPVNSWLEQWVRAQSSNVRATIHRDVGELTEGDFLFLISCHQIVRKTVRDRFRYTLVLHASDLPRGRGMSPHIWQVLEGRERIVLSLLNAEDEVDSGQIWYQLEIQLDGTELHDEIDAHLFQAELRLMDWALKQCDSTLPREQVGTPTFYRRRTPADSEIDPAKPLAESFNLLRVANPVRYPAHFEYRGQKYIIRIEKVKS
jgi:methionyl-tRNA formyltransferase